MCVFVPFLSLSALYLNCVCSFVFVGSWMASLLGPEYVDRTTLIADLYPYNSSISRSYDAPRHEGIIETVSNY
ncbi:hypothetical protein E4T42_00503 [Aureobasidium subglaciale]|nr:hypothetical protein E4T42_00503 [Aureobasidium subglaciale]